MVRLPPPPPQVYYHCLKTHFTFVQQVSASNGFSADVIPSTFNPSAVGNKMVTHEHPPTLCSQTEVRMVEDIEKLGIEAHLQVFG